MLTTTSTAELVLHAIALGGGILLMICLVLVHLIRGGPGKVRPIGTGTTIMVTLFAATLILGGVLPTSMFYSVLGGVGFFLLFVFWLLLLG